MTEDITGLVSSSEIEERRPERLVAVMTIVAHPEPQRLGAWVEVPLRPMEMARLTPLFRPRGPGAERPIEDVFVSRSPLVAVYWTGHSVRVLRATERASVVVDGQPLGASVEVELRGLKRGVLMEFEPRTAVMIHLTRAPRPDPGPAAAWLRGVSNEIERLREEVERVAALDITVLVRGETGTGKELVARALHHLSRRAGNQYAAMSVAELAPQLVASTLFGHRRGAFTGADDDRAGLFRKAHGGTLMLDEIGEASDEVQRSLLRALEERKITPVGSDQSVPVDVRVIAATDAPLEEAIAARSFREPLYHRLAEFELNVPPLRARRVDIPLLFEYFVGLFAARMSLPRPAPDARSNERWIDARQVRRLLRYDWPGNVRELENVARRAVIDYPQTGRIRVPPDLRGVDTSAAPTDEHAMVDESRWTGAGGATALSPDATVARLAMTPSRPARAIAEVGAAELLAALEAAEWRPAHAAKRLEISTTSIYQLIRANGDIPESRRLERAEIVSAVDGAGGDLARAAMVLRVPLRGLKLRMTRLGLSHTAPADNGDGASDD